MYHWVSDIRTLKQNSLKYILKKRQKSLNGKVYKVHNTYLCFILLTFIPKAAHFKGLLHKGGFVLQDCDAKVGVKLLTPFLFKGILNS